LSNDNESRRRSGFGAGLREARNRPDNAALLMRKAARPLISKLTIPCNPPLLLAVQSNMVYLPQEVLLVSASLGLRQKNANR